MLSLDNATPVTRGHAYVNKRIIKLNNELHACFLVINAPFIPDRSARPESPSSQVKLVSLLTSASLSSLPRLRYTLGHPDDPKHSHLWTQAIWASACSGPVLIGLPAPCILALMACAVSSVRGPAGFDQFFTGQLVRLIRIMSWECFPAKFA